MNGVTFLVCGALTIFTGPVMRRFEARSVLIFCALCNMIGTFMFISAHNYYIMVIGRALSGVAQAWVCTYGPVWINEFGPVERRATWMGIYTSFGIIGSVIGIILGSIAADNE